MTYVACKVFRAFSIKLPYFTIQVYSANSISTCNIFFRKLNIKKLVAALQVLKSFETIEHS